MAGLSVVDKNLALLICLVTERLSMVWGRGKGKSQGMLVSPFATISLSIFTCSFVSIHRVPSIDKLLTWYTVNCQSL